MTLIRVDSNLWLLAAMMFVVGSGIGLFMQTLVLSVQNSVSYGGHRHRNGHRHLLPDAWRGHRSGGARGHPGGAGDHEHRPLRRSFRSHAGPLHAFTHGMDVGFLYSVPAAVVSFLLAFFLRRSSSGLPPRLTATGLSSDQPGSAFGSDWPDPGGRSHSPRGPNPSPAIEPL